MSKSGQPKCLLPFEFSPLNGDLELARDCSLLQNGKLNCPFYFLPLCYFNVIFSSIFFIAQPFKETLHKLSCDGSQNHSKLLSYHERALSSNPVARNAHLLTIIVLLLHPMNIC